MNINTVSYKINRRNSNHNWLVVSEENSRAVSIEANHTVKSLEDKIKLLSEELASSEEVRIFAEAERTTVKITEKNSKYEIVGVEDPITDVKILGQEPGIKSWRLEKAGINRIRPQVADRGKPRIHIY